MQIKTLPQSRQFTKPTTPLGKEIAKSLLPRDGRDNIYQYREERSTSRVIRAIIEETEEQAFCLLNEGKLRERVRLLQEHFIPERASERAISYAMKANPHPRVLQVLHDEGITDFDCASVEEIRAVRRINPSASIYFNHPIKKKKDIRFALQHGVRHMTVQSQKEIEKIKQCMDEEGEETAEIAARLMTLNEEADINLSEKFGAPEDDVREMLKRMRENPRILPGISVHTGSQNRDPFVYVKAMQQMEEIAKQIGKMKTINIGGGLPANYEDSDTFDIKEYLLIISQVIRQRINNILLPDPRIIIELGRSMIAEAIDLIVPVLSVEKRGDGRAVYMDDGVFTSFSDSTIHGWKYPLKVIGKNGQERRTPKKEFTLFGRTCDSGDSLGKVCLPWNIDEGDYIHVPSAGAYHDSQSTRFNGFEPPKYVSYNI